MLVAGECRTAAGTFYAYHRAILLALELLEQDNYTTVIGNQSTDTLIEIDYFKDISIAA